MSATPKPAVGPPVLPSPLEADDVLVLRWIGEEPRACACQPPANLSFGLMSACRRKLLKLGLVAIHCPPGLPCYYLLAPAGEKLLAELAAVEAETRTARKKRLSKRKKAA